VFLMKKSKVNFYPIMYLISIFALLFFGTMLFEANTEREIATYFKFAAIFVFILSVGVFFRLCFQVFGIIFSRMKKGSD